METCYSSCIQSSWLTGVLIAEYFINTLLVGNSWTSYLNMRPSCRIEQQQAENKLEQLQQTLEAKQAQMARVLSGDGQMATLRSHYDRVLTELQAERDELQREHSDILQVKWHIPSALSSALEGHSNLFDCGPRTVP